MPIPAAIPRAASSTSPLVPGLEPMTLLLLLVMLSSCLAIHPMASAPGAVREMLLPCSEDATWRFALWSSHTPPCTTARQPSGTHGRLPGSAGRREQSRENWRSGNWGTAQGLLFAGLLRRHGPRRRCPLPARRAASAGPATTQPLSRQPGCARPQPSGQPQAAFRSILGCQEPTVN